MAKLTSKSGKKTASATKKTTATKKRIPASVKDKYFITDLSETDKAKTKTNAKKNAVRLNIYKKVQKAIENAKKKKSESKLGRLEKIFTTDDEGKTIATIRYGSVIFYQGRMEQANVFDRKGKENFENKLGALNHLKMMLEADEWFDPQYKKYLAIKELADKRSAATKKANKTKASATKSATKAPATKVSAKSSAKTRSTKASASKASSKKASSKTIKKK